LLEFIEDRLDPGTKAKIAGHVEGCERCRRQAEEFRVTLALLANDPVPPIGMSEERFIQDVKRRVRQQREAPVRWAWLRPAPILGTALALLIAVGMLWQFGRRVDFAVPGTRSRTEAVRVISPQTTESGDMLDPLAGDTTGIDVLAATEMPAIDSVETEVIDNSDVDDLIDELPPAEQAVMVEQLEQIYGVKRS